MAFTPQNLSSAALLTDIALSPDGTKVVYGVNEPKVGGEQQKASLWYASDLFKEDKVESSQITSGQFYDRAPQWHKDAKTIYFLSDRVDKAGGPSQIYKLSITGPGEPSILDPSFKEKKRGVEEFKISPDGLYIAFRSAAEPSNEDKKKEEEKDDPEVWSDTKSNAHLRIYTISTGETKTLVDSGHVFDFTWSSDSKNLAYLLARRASLEALYERVTVQKISIIPGSTPITLKFFEVSTSYDIVWPSSRPELYMIASYHPEQLIDARAVKQLSMSGGTTTQNALTNFHTGETEDCHNLTDIGNGEIAARVLHGIDNRIDILDHNGKVFELYDTGGAEALGEIDVKQMDDTYYFACVRTSAPRKEAPNVYVGRTKKNEKLLNLKQISSHNPWIASHKLGAVEQFYWKGEDGTDLGGIAWFPEGLDSSKVKTPLPAIVLIHGGPYYRDVPRLATTVNLWADMLAENGYLVLCPNYRGSSGRGSDFAREAYGAVGSVEVSDIERMADEAVKRGLADSSKLGIGGWSQGGFLTACVVGKTKSKFKCAVMGAGPSEGASMIMESDAFSFIEPLTGAAPWFGAKARLDGDPIRYANDIETAFLIIHGQSDVRVPVGQSVGYHRALRRVSKYPHRHELVIYPREPHVITEKKHGEDMLKRVLAHYQTWLK